MNIQSTVFKKINTPKVSTPPAQDGSTFSGSKDKIGDALDTLTLSAFTLGTGTMDLGMSVGYLSGTQNSTFEVAGLCVAGAHVAYGLGSWIGGGNANEYRNSELAKTRLTHGTGHILTGIGHGAAALGAGGWALGPLVGGLAIRALEDYRTRT